MFLIRLSVRSKPIWPRVVVDVSGSGYSIGTPSDNQTKALGWMPTQFFHSHGEDPPKIIRDREFPWWLHRCSCIVALFELVVVGLEARTKNEILGCCLDQAEQSGDVLDLT